MIRSKGRHHTEEELLMHVLGEEAPETIESIAAHLVACHECCAVFQEYAALVNRISDWSVPEVAEQTWQARKAELMRVFRQDQEWMRRKGLIRHLQWGVQKVWDYALENPLPTMGYIVAAVAFASERTITVFRLDRILPATGEVIKILMQIL